MQVHPLPEIHWHTAANELMGIISTLILFITVTDHHALIFGCVYDMTAVA